MLRVWGKGEGPLAFGVKVRVRGRDSARVGVRC